MCVIIIAFVSDAGVIKWLRKWIVQGGAMSTGESLITLEVMRAVQRFCQLALAGLVEGDYPAWIYARRWPHVQQEPGCHGAVILVVVLLTQEHLIAPYTTAAPGKV